MELNQENITCEVLKRIGEGFREAGNKEVWERGWGEIAEKIKKENCPDGFNPNDLRPQYIKEDVCRYKGKYQMLDYWAVDKELRRNGFTFIKGNKIVELGCGTGINQIELAKIFFDIPLVAADWVNASQEIIKEISKNIDHPIKPVNFNMATLEGWDDLEIDENSCVLTVHALEQVSNWQPLLDKLIESKALCVHIEPFYELYDQYEQFDQLAIRYHKKREYFTGYLPKIVELELQKKTQIIRIERVHFGNRFHDSYSILVWKAI